MSEQNPQLDDPDLQQSDSSLDEVEDEREEAEDLASDTLDGDEDDTWEPDQHLSNATAELIEHGDRNEETLSERLAQEVPDVGAVSGGDADSDRDYRQV
ncbi:hypothetical protein ACFQ46_22810 [Kineococcus sp. GCM10028916]|uniref:hypothetical protein n=1 Tax=Kineococcus sp. GCM10028916 TaxID=3273394 RepID=UPI0036433758